jgi:hypothetical protein
MDDDGSRPGSGTGEARTQPGEQRRRLERPPGERYTEAAAPAASREEEPHAALGQALVVAAIAAGLIALLGGPLSLTVGLLAVAAVGGWLIGSLLRPRVGAAIALAVGAVVVGLAGVWLFSRLEGGVLDPVTYIAEVHGPLVIVELAVAAIAAGLATR